MLGMRRCAEDRSAPFRAGQKQKVAIASILALQPDIILLDEPTGELDPESTIMILRFCGG